MERTTVQARNKSFHHFAGNQSKVVELVKLFYVEYVFQILMIKYNEQPLLTEAVL